jgi:hypothetical protein
MGGVMQTSRRSAPRRKRITGLYLTSRGAVARGRYVNGRVIVEAGSVADARLSSSGKVRPEADLRRHLIREGAMVKVGRHYILTRDVVVDNPSQAAGLMAGTALSGNVMWKKADGTELGTIRL